MSPDPRPGLADLPRGHNFSPVSFRLSAADTARYLEAVEDANRAYFDDRESLAWAPPLAAAAFALKAVTDQAHLPSGSLHAAQEVEFRCPIPVDADLTCRAVVAQRSEMRGMAVCVVEFEVSVAGQEGAALVGRATVIAPLAQEKAGD